MSDFVRLYGLQLARLLCPWNFPGKNTRVSCHFLFQGSSRPRARDQTWIICIAGRFFTVWATREAHAHFILPDKYSRYFWDLASILISGTNFVGGFLPTLGRSIVTPLNLCLGWYLFGKLKALVSKLLMVSKKHWSLSLKERIQSSLFRFLSRQCLCQREECKGHLNPVPSPFIPAMRPRKTWMKS